MNTPLSFTKISYYGAIGTAIGQASYSLIIGKPYCTLFGDTAKVACFQLSSISISYLLDKALEKERVSFRDSSLNKMGPLIEAISVYSAMAFSIHLATQSGIKLNYPGYNTPYAMPMFDVSLNSHDFASAASNAFGNVLGSLLAIASS